MTETDLPQTPREKPLRPWMKFLLRFAAWFNLGAGLHMLILYHETYKVIGMPKPVSHFPIQLVGLLVALFGLGYYLVAKFPVQNRHLLLVGFLSKLLGSCLGLAHIALGKLPPRFFWVFFFADIVYLPPFWLIYRRLEAWARDRTCAEERPL